MNRREMIAGSVAAAAWCGRAVRADGGAPLAATTAGKVSGQRVGGVLVFKGVPYGADTRTTRFLPPKKVAGWSGVKECLGWGPRAPQQTPDRKPPNPLGQGYNALEDAPMRYHLPPDEGPQTEDCLYLNVWTAGLRDGRKRPVLVYFHGGAYNNGTVNAALYDGTRLVQRGGVVVVTVNGRLNAFGFLELGELLELGQLAVRDTAVPAT